MIGTIITRPISKNNGRPMSSATTAIIHGSVRGVECRGIVDRSRSAAPDSAINAPSIAPSAMMMPTSPSNAPAAFADRARDRLERQACREARRERTDKVDRNGASFSTLMKMSGLSRREGTDWARGQCFASPA